MDLTELFPGLRGKALTVTSPHTFEYNCIAWAAGRTKERWWASDDEGVFWPHGVPHEETLEAFQAAFATLGYIDCPDAAQETGFEKIAIFADAYGGPQHAARQLPTGLWTSKLGKLEDIEHELRDLEGDAYGTVALVMKRPISAVVG